MSFADYGAPVDPLYRDLGLIKFNDLVHLTNSLFVHSIFQKTLPESLLKTFEIDATHAYPTRASKAGLLNSLANKTTYFGINSIKNQCILSWNHCHTIQPSLLHDLTTERLKSTLIKSFIDSY